MSLRVFEKQSPHSQWDCLPYGYDVATCARNDMQRAQPTSLPAHAFGRLQSQAGEEFDALLPSRGDAAQSVLDRAFKGELS